MRILIVDDESLIRRSLTRVFEDRGHEVVSADNGKDGLESWQSSDFDLVILDVLMPQLTGPQVISERGTKHRSKVVLISAYSGTGFDLTAVPHDMFVAKPFQDIFSFATNAEKLVYVSCKSSKS